MFLRIRFGQIKLNNEKYNKYMSNQDLSDLYLGLCRVEISDTEYKMSIKVIDIYNSMEKLKSNLDIPEKRSSETENTFEKIIYVFTSTKQLINIT